MFAQNIFFEDRELRYDSRKMTYYNILNEAELIVMHEWDVVERKLADDNINYSRVQNTTPCELKFVYNDQSGI